MTVDQGGYSPEKNPAETLGDTFRATRVAARVSVEQVEADLRIKAKYIEAIEDNDSASLPSRAYTDGFLRNYATYLGMDPAESVRRFAAENDLTETLPRMAPAKPIPTKKKKAAGGLAGATPQRRGIGGALGRTAAALGPLFLVAGLGFGGYTGYVAARDAGLIPPELGGAPRADTGETQAASAEPDDENTQPSDADVAEKPPASDAGADEAPVETAAATGDKPESDIVGNETTTGRPDSLSYARKGAVPYWQAKPPSVEPADGPVADIKPETAGLLRAGDDDDGPDSRASRWSARSARANPPADVDASRIAAAAREALFGGTSAAETQAPADPETDPSVVADSGGTEQPGAPQPVPGTQPAAIQPEPQIGIGPVETASQTLIDLAPAQPAQAPRRFALVAQSDTWVQVTNSFGSVTYTGILSAGEAYNIPSQDGLRLKTGNAGGLYIEVDGQRFGPLGSNGAVMRNVTLNPGAVRASFTLSQAVGLSQ